MNRLSSRFGVVAIALLAVVTGSIAVVVAVDSGGGPAEASSPATSRTISVSGDGTVQGVPDTAVASLEVHRHDFSVQSALDSVATDIHRVIASLGSSGVPRRDIQTTNLSLDPSYDSHGQVNGYDASESMSVSITPLDRVGTVISAATKSTGNSVSIDGLSLNISQDGALLNQARGKAFDAAKAAAMTDAALAGEKLGQVISIKETSQSVSTPPPLYGGDTLAFASAKSIAIRGGQQPVTVALAVVWSLQ